MDVDVTFIDFRAETSPERESQKSIGTQAVRLCGSVSLGVEIALLKQGFPFSTTPCRRKWQQ